MTSIGGVRERIVGERGGEACTITRLQDSGPMLGEKPLGG